MRTCKISLIVIAVALKGFQMSRALMALVLSTFVVLSVSVPPAAGQNARNQPQSTLSAAPPAPRFPACCQDCSSLNCSNCTSARDHSECGEDEYAANCVTKDDLVTCAPDHGR